MGDEPEVIMQNMEETRSALAEKIETLEQQVVSTVQDATVAVADTVDNVKAAFQETVDQVKDSVQETVSSVRESVTDTVDTVKQTFDLQIQIQQRPWVVFGVAVAVGFAGGKLFGPTERLAKRVWRSTRRPATNGSEYASGFAPMDETPVSETPAEEVASRMSEASEPVPEPAHTGPTMLNQLVEGFEPELNKLKGLAIGTLMGSIRQLVIPQIPDQVRPQVGDLIDSVTRKLGGEPIQTA